MIRRPRSLAAVKAGKCTACERAWEECSCADRMAERRASLLARGLCANCATPVETGKTQCAACLDLRAARAKARATRLKALGLCARCGEPAAPGRILCAPHLEDQREADRKRDD